MLLAFCISAKLEWLKSALKFHTKIREVGGHIFILENELALGAAFFVLEQLPNIGHFSFESFYLILL